MVWFLTRMMIARGQGKQLSGQRVVAWVLSVLLCWGLGVPEAHGRVRMKDVVNFEGIRENMLMGYGLVVGLNGTGDKVTNSKFTEESMVSFLERLGVNTRGTQLKPKNVAAVTVTATLPPFARNGSRIDVNVSAMGDAKSLQGGILLATPLYGPDGEVYSVAQGAVAIGGFAAGGDSANVVKGVPTSGVVASGGIVEREVGFVLNDMQNMNISLKNPDITTASNIAKTINAHMGGDVARVLDPATISLPVPYEYQNNVIALLAEIERLEIETDQPARVVIDEATGTIVMGENVRIDKVAIAQGNLVVAVTENPQVSQPGAFAPEGAETAVVPRTDINVDEGTGKMAVLERAATLSDLVQGLNSLGVGPRDMITILQNIKAAGALQAEIETR